MEPASDPTRIPPPLRDPGPEPELSATRTADPVVVKSEQDRPELFGMVIAAATLMMLILVGLFMARNDTTGESVGGEQGGNEQTEGVLAGESSTGDTLENGQDEATTAGAEQEIAANKADGSQAAQEGSNTESEEDEAVGGDGLTKDVRDVEGRSVEDRDLKEEDQQELIEKNQQKEVTLALVPNRQNTPAARASNGPLGGGGSGDGAGLDLGATKGLNPFVGDGKPATTTVFVIDVSSSMQVNDKLPRVMNALSRAIDQLSSKQKFCVILFDHGYYFAPGVTGLEVASVDSKRRAKLWLAQAPGGGGTMPIGAMTEAIGLRPERIVLLSDGEFDPTNVQMITMLNHQGKKPAKIDCVGLMEDVLVLREIANQNKGVYYQAW